MEVGGVINAAGGLLFAALGATILVGAPRTRTNVLFGTFLLTFGAPFIFANFVNTVLVGAVWAVVAWAVAASWVAAGILLMAFWVQPEASGAVKEWKEFALPMVLTAVYLVIVFTAFFPSEEPYYEASFFLWAAAFWFGLILLALTFPRLVRDGRHAHASRSIVLSLGLAIFPAFSAGTTLHDGLYLGLKETGLGFGPLFWLDLLFSVIVGLLWIRNSASLERRWGRRARDLGLTILGLGLGGMILGVSPLDPQTLGTQGISRAIGVLILVYGVLRHQLLGIDVKLRWGLSRSTIAAVFVAVFFIASEGAQIVFGQGNEWTGLLAAGGLVFAIAPLQRAAERLAEKAVPAVTAATSEGSVGPASSGSQEAIFCRAVRLALRDGKLSRNEERELVAIAFDLRLPPQRAFELRDKVVGTAEAGADAKTGAEVASR